MSVLFTVSTGPVCGMSNIEAQLFLDYFNLESEYDGSGAISGKELLKELEHADPSIIANCMLNYNKLTEAQVVEYLEKLTEMATLAAAEDDAVCWS
jgi:hypothetical protein